MTAPSLFASPERRLDGTDKTTGVTKYTADLEFPGALEAAFVRSPYPHARIRSVDAARARSLPGVRAVITGADVGGARLGRRLVRTFRSVEQILVIVGPRFVVVLDAGGNVRKDARKQSRLTTCPPDERLDRR